MVKGLRGSNKGAFTVEATLVVPVILLVLFLLIYCFMILYQTVVLNRAAAFTAQQGAEVWLDSRKIIETGEFGSTAMDGLYTRVLNDYLLEVDRPLMDAEAVDLSKSLETLYGEASTNSSDVKDKKLYQIKAGLFKNLKGGILKPEKTTVDVKFTNRMLERKLDVTITQEVRIPLGMLKSIFSGKSTLTLEGRGTAAVAEPAEYIRNIDFGIECARRVKDAVNIDALLDKIKGGSGAGE